MALLIFTDLADADNAFILADLAKTGGAKVAQKYAAEFKALYRLFTQFPLSGSPRPGLGRFTRMGVVWPYNVYYEYNREEDVVTVMRVLHGRQRVTGKRLRGSRSQR